MKKFKTALITLLIVTITLSANSQNTEKMKTIESRHEFTALVQSANLILETAWGNYSHDKEHIIAVKDHEEIEQAHAVALGHCEDGVKLSTALVKINKNLIYVLSVGTAGGMEKGEIKIMLSKISDGETTTLVNGIYKKERYKMGVNQYYEIVNFDIGLWGSNFYVMLKDYYDLTTFCLPNVPTDDRESLKIFEVSKYFHPCNE